MSRVTTKQYSLLPPRHLVPSIAFEAMSFTVEIAFTVDLDFLKPNCMCDRSLAAEMASYSLLLMHRSSALHLAWAAGPALGCGGGSSTITAFLFPLVSSTNSSRIKICVRVCVYAFVCVYLYNP